MANFLVDHEYTLDITPSARPQLVYVSEYDVGRIFSFTITKDGEEMQNLTSALGTVTVEGTIGSYAFSEPASIENGKIVFQLTESMTAHAGKAWTKIKFANDDAPISTCAFFLVVDRAGVEADTVIGASGFEEQIRGAVDESVAEYLNDFAIDDDVVRDAVDDYLDENGIDTESIATATTDWLNDNVTPVGSAVVVDSSLSVEGAAADAAAVGEFKSMTGIEIVVDKTEYESNSFKIIPSGTYTLIGNETYDEDNGNVLTGYSDAAKYARNDTYYMVYPGSNLVLPMRFGVIFYDFYKKYVYGTHLQNGGTITVPESAYYARFHTRGWGNNATSRGYFESIATNVEVLSVYANTNTLHTKWENVDGKESFVETVNKSAEFSNRASRAFKMYDIAIQSGEIVPVAQGKVYATNPYVAGSSTGSGTVTFYDSEMQPILFPSTGSTSSSISGGFRVVGSPSTTPETRGGQYFTINGNIVHGVHIHSNPSTYDFELPSSPAFVKFSCGSAQWTVGDSTYADAIPDDLQWVLYDEENNRGFLEQIQKHIVDGILTSATTSELGRWMRFNAIKEANKKIHAFRVASFNIYGASKHKSNWSAVRDALQNYGIDLIGFQEVYDPLDETTQDGVTFADAMSSWQFNQFDDVGQFKACACTSEFVMLESSYFAYTTQSGYGSRGYVKTEVRLPRWKAKNWSHYIKASIYNTQLEVGANQTGINTRLAQVAELTAAMNADPNPFIILTGDFNEMAADRSTFAAIAAAGFTPVLADDSTPTSYRGYYDNIFVNDRISIVDNDVIPYSDNGSGLSDHDLLFADLVFDYSNIIAVKKAGEHCTISGVEDWLDRRQTETVTVTITPDSGYTVSAISTGQGDNDLTYNNGAVVKNGNTITIKPNLVVGDIWINVTTAAAS